MTAGAYRPIRNVRKRLHINLQYSNFLRGGTPTPPPIFHLPPLPPTFFLQKRLHIKKPFRNAPGQDATCTLTHNPLSNLMKSNNHDNVFHEILTFSVTMMTGFMKI